MLRAIARSIRQGQGLRSFHKDGAIEGNNLTILWLFDCFSTPVNGPLQEKNLLELANHESARYIGYKHKPCDKESYLWTANRQFKVINTIPAIFNYKAAFF